MRRTPEGPNGRAWHTTPFGRSIPLFALAGVFFVAGTLVALWWPHYGPGAFALWALLVALGFISSIGGVASWLLPGDEPSEESTTEPYPSRAAPRARGHAAEDARGERPAVRSEFGRPAPDVARPEGRSPVTASPLDPLPAPASHARPPNWSEEGAVSVEREPVRSVLADLDGIEQELAPRRPTAPPASS